MIYLKNFLLICFALRNAKSLVKHLLVADLTKRFGNLKGGSLIQSFLIIYFFSFIGVNDIKNHRWFNEVDWELLLQKKIVAPYKPYVK